MPKPWLQHRAWTSCESCNGFGTPSQTCAEHAMASVHRSHGCIIGDGDMCGSYNGSSMPEPWFHNRFLELNYVHPVCRYSGIVFLSILFSSMLPVSTNRGNKQKEKHATKPQNFQTIHSVFCFLIALVGAVCLFSIIVCMPTRTPNGFSSTVMASWISVRIDSSLTWGEYL